jgi:hypothetical protein
MDENQDARFLVTRRALLETGTATAALCTGLSQVALVSFH